MVTWQPMSENEWIQAIMSALAAGRALPAPPPEGPGPFALADPERIRRVLGGAGFTAVETEAVSADMWFGDDGPDAHRFILGLMAWMLGGLDAEGREEASDALLATMTEHETPGGVILGSGFWTTTAVRR
jgi:hypothetical protein